MSSGVTISDEELDRLLMQAQLSSAIDFKSTQFAPRSMRCEKCWAKIGRSTKRIMIHNLDRLIIFDENDVATYSGKCPGIMAICLECKSRWFFRESNKDWEESS